jgi:class 3 adenylate cyclase
MPKLTAAQRARLPDSAFAYIDSQGRRRLPIHDESHVRNALSRFGRVAFEDDAGRERARIKLLNAAKRYGIVPVGFITGQLRMARSTDAGTLPRGFVTFLLTDIEDSTGILRKLGDRYAGVLRAVREIVRRAVAEAGGREVDARADEFFAAFRGASNAVQAAVAIQRKLSERAWPDGLECRVRVGIHSGRPMLTDSGYIGLAVHTAARVCSVAHGGQILLSEETRTAVGGSLPAGVRLRSLGSHQLAGLTHPEELFQVHAEGLLEEFPGLPTAAATSG